MISTDTVTNRVRNISRWQGAVIIVFLIIAVTAWLLSPLLSPFSVDRPEDAAFTAEENMLFREEQTIYPVRGGTIPVEGRNISLGVANNPEELNFGRIPVNASTIKIVDVGTPRPAYVSPTVFGNITPHLSSSRPGVVDGNTEIRFTFAPQHRGNFTGVVVIDSVIPQNRVAAAVITVIS